MGVSFEHHAFHRIDREATLATKLIDALSMPTSRKAFGSTTLMPFDVLGLGEAMIDYSVCVPEEALEEFGVVKGGRRIVGFEERVKILRRVAENYVLSAGSSVGNTLVAMSQLSHAEGNRLRLGFAGCVGSDREGKFYAMDLKSNHIDVMECAPEGSERMTGCVIVLITPDAQRSFLVCPGEAVVKLTPRVKQGIAAARVLLIEGYLFAMPQALEVIKEAILLAKQSETLVAVTAGAADVIKSCLAGFWDVIAMGIDMFLCNLPEAAALLEEECEDCCAYGAVKRLHTHFPIVAVTDGSKGSYIATTQQLQPVAPYWRQHAPVDTCGAGDVYAAGLMLGYLRGYSVGEMGLLASCSASAIISKQGAQLSADDAIGILVDISKHKAAESIKAFCN